MARGRLRITEDIEVRSNLTIQMRERGKLIAKRVGHNIWLDLGREYLASLIAYQSYGPDTPERNDRVRYMGLGVGGTRQLISPVPDPVGASHPGTNLQTDTDPTVTGLERPVRISGSSLAYPGLVGDVWLGELQVPVDHVLPTEATFRRVFLSAEVNYDPFLSVPLSEIGLFTDAADPGIYNNNPIAYDTFDTLSKTSSFELQVDWTIRF